MPFCLNRKKDLKFQTTFIQQVSIHPLPFLSNSEKDILRVDPVIPYGVVYRENVNCILWTAYLWATNISRFQAVCVQTLKRSGPLTLLLRNIWPGNCRWQIGNVKNNISCRKLQKIRDLMETRFSSSTPLRRFLCYTYKNSRSKHFLNHPWEFEHPIVNRLWGVLQTKWTIKNNEIGHFSNRKWRIWFKMFYSRVKPTFFCKFHENPLTHLGKKISRHDLVPRNELVSHPIDN